MHNWLRICNVFAKINRFVMYLGIVCLLAMTCLITVEIVCRGIFNFSTMICDEYTGYFVAGMTFFGGAYAMSQGSFLKVDLLYIHFKGVTKKVIDFINGVIGIIYILFLTKFCWSVIKYSIEGNVVSIFHSATPLAIPQSVMLIGCILLLIQQFIDLINDVFIGEEKLQGKGEVAKS